MALRLRTALNPFKDEFIDSTIDLPQSYREIFAGLGTDTQIENALIICEDLKIDPKDYDKIPDDNSRIYIRIFPEGTGSQTKDAGKGMSWAGGLMMAGGLVLSILTGWTGIGGAAGAALMGAGVGVLMGGITLYNTDVTVPSIRSKKDRASTEPDPMLRGGKNAKRPYGAIPVVLGKHLVTPDVAADPFTTVDGISEDGADEPQWLTQLFCAGYSGLDIDLHSFKVGDTPLVNLSKTKDINKILSGEDDYIQMSIQDGSEDEVKYFPKVIKEKQFNLQLKHLSDDGDEFAVNYTTPENVNQINVDIYFPFGLLHYNDNNDPENAEVKVEVLFKLTTEDAWRHTQNFTITSNKTKTLRFSHTISVTTAGQYDVKIQRITADRNDDNKYVDNVYIGSIRCYKDDETVSLEARKKTCLISLKTKATDFIEGIVDSLNFIATSKIPDYDNDGTGTGPEHWSVRATSNPASLVLYVLRGQINGTPVKDSDIDWAAFASFWKFCRDHGYMCNAVLNGDLTISELYSNIARIGRGTIIKRDQKFSVIYDSTKYSPVQLFTPRNTTGYSQSILKPDVPDQIDYEFIDADAGYQTNTRSVYNTPSGEKESISPKTRQETSVWGITNAKQLFKFARYQQAVSNFRDIVHTIECDIEMLMCHQGDLIEYSGDTALRGMAAGRIARLLYNSNGLAIGMESDTALPFEGKSHAIRCRLSTGVLKTINVTAYSEGTYKTCYFSEPVSGLQEGDLFSFGERENVTEQLIITGISPGDDLTATITAVDYAPEIFEVDDPNYLVPEFDQKLTVGGKIDDGIIANPTEGWSTYTVYNDSKEMPAPPIGVGQNGGWHSINTINSKWYSEKVARSIREGSWSAPRPIDVDRDLTAPTVPVISDITVSEYGNLSFTFGGSSDSQSGVKKYNVYINNILSASIDFNQNFNQYSFTYETPSKNSIYQIFVTAVDNENNESKASEVRTALSTVTVTPLPPTNLVAVANGQGISLEWEAPDTLNAALLPHKYIVEVSRNGGSTYTVFAEKIAASAFYSFRFTDKQDYSYQNEIDGYLEKDDIVKNYRFRVKSVSIYGNESVYIQQNNIDVNSYLTWKITGLSATCRATEKLISLAWTANPDFYGTLRYDLYKGESKLLDGASVQAYRDYLESYPEKEDLDEVSYRLVARTEADAAELSGITVDTSGYLTYKVTPPAVSVRADEFGLHIGWTGKSEPYYLQPVYDVLVDGIKVAEGMSALSLDVPFPEDNPYPRKDDVASMEVIIAARTEADEAHSEAAHPDVTGFKGWVPSVPRLYITASGRTVPLSWDVQDIWGWRGCDIQVARAYKVEGGEYVPITDESELEWYAPALGKNPYESLDNYRHGDAGGWLSADGTSVAFTVPLWGQQKDEAGNIMGAVNTLYAYRVRGASIAEKSEWSEPFYAEARATSAFDVVKAWRLNDNGEKVRVDGALGARQIFVEELAALSANLGLITDGGLFGGDYNYWAVNDTPMPNGSTLWKGSFRVGDESQYIKATPVLDEAGNPTGRIDLEFRAGQFTINASGTRIDGKSFEVYDADGNLMFSVSPEGSKIRVEEGTYNSKDVQLDIDTRIYYTNALTVQWNNEVYIFVPNYPEDTESTLDYAVSVFKVEDASRHELVWTIQGVYAYIIFIYASYISYVRTDNGRFFFVGPDMENEDALNYYIYDIAARSCGAVPVPEKQIETFMNNDFYNLNPMFFIDGVQFIYTKTEETLADNTTLVSVNILLVTREHILKLLPGNGVYDTYGVIGVAVHGGFAYASANWAFASCIVRCNLTTGELSFCIFYGSVQTNYSDFKEVNGSGLMVDDYGMRLFGQCTVITSMDPYVTESFWGSVGIPHAAARWNDWDGISEFESAAATTGIETYIYFSESEAERHGRLFPQFAFVSAGQLFVTELSTKDGSITTKLFRLHLADNDPPEVSGDITRRGALVADSAVLSFHVDEENFDETYKIYATMGLQGVCFPNTVVGIDAVQMAFSRLVLQNEQEQTLYPSLYTVFKEQKILVTGSNVYAAGIGFYRIVYDAVSKKYRYYLDTGAWLEFDADGRLIAQGEKGEDGRDGKDGRDGRDGVDGKDGKDGTLNADNAVTADIADANYAVGVKADGEVTKTLWSKVWEWIKGKVATKSMASDIINACGTGEDSNLADTDWILTQYAKGSTSSVNNNEPIKRKLSAFWTWIAGKITGNEFSRTNNSANPWFSLTNTAASGDVAVVEAKLTNGHSVKLLVGSGHSNIGLYVRDIIASGNKDYWLIRSGNDGKAYSDAPNGLQASKFIGPVTGNVTGNCTGSSGSCTGNAATATVASRIRTSAPSSPVDGDIWLA
ncbi:MAG: hypothetical protein HDR56_01540 [Treponema sp.]|nr:hypothetical protein [Treponema sp.]